MRYTFREEIKSQIQALIEENPEHVVCTDIERILLMVEELEITYLPLQECGRGKTPGNIDRKATPLILDRSSDLSEILKDHTIYTTVLQLSEVTDGPITFKEDFIYSFQVDTTCITMPLATNGRIDADDISSPRSVGRRSRPTAPPSPKPPRRVGFSTSEETIRDMLHTQTSLLKHLDPKTFGDVLGKAVSEAIASNLTGTSLGTTGATKTARVPGTTSVAIRGAPNNQLTIKLGPNESISDYICELPKTTGKIPRLGTWNEGVLPREVKKRYDAARGLTDFLTSDLIDTPYVYQVDDGTVDATGVVVPVQHTSRTFWHPCMAGALMIAMVHSYNPTLTQMVSSRLLPNSKTFVDTMCEHGTSNYGVKDQIMDFLCQRMSCSTTKRPPTMLPVETMKTICFQVTVVHILLDGVLVLQLSFARLKLCLTFIRPRKLSSLWIMVMQ